MDQNALMEQANEIVSDLIELEDYPIAEEDMQGEAYLALAEAMNQYGDYLTPEIAEEAILKHLHQIKEDHLAQQENDSGLIRQMEVLNECIDKLTEELGDKPNLDELANEMGVTQERVIEILKLTGEEVPGNP
ncbi:MAG: hypothetical protein KBS83_03930 [Lachnospiraceae bacterium]|nr:hypothetical protein [Candidatus Equihabitans merdae]